MKAEGLATIAVARKTRDRLLREYRAAIRTLYVRVRELAAAKDASVGSDIEDALPIFEAAVRRLGREYAEGRAYLRRAMEAGGSL